MSVSTLVKSLLKAQGMSLVLLTSSVLLSGCGAGSADTNAQTESASTSNTDSGSDGGSNSGSETGGSGGTGGTTTPQPEAHSLTLTTQPTNATVYEGQNKTFSLAVSHNYPITISWYKNGTKINGATGLNYTVSSATTSKAGTYSCAVTDGELTQNCNNFTLTVNKVVVITGQPSNQMVNEGVDVSLTVAATGTGPLSYQWYFNSKLISGATKASLAIDAVTTLNDGNYYCIVSNAGSTATSSSAAVSVAANASGSAQISWNAPTKRSDGSTLNANEIASYELFYASTAGGNMTQLTTLPANELNIVVNELSTGTHYFALATVDTRGQESAKSSTFSVTID